MKIALLIDEIGPAINEYILRKYQLVGGKQHWRWHTDDDDEPTVSVIVDTEPPKKKDD